MIEPRAGEPLQEVVARLIAAVWQLEQRVKQLENSQRATYDELERLSYK